MKIADWLSGPARRQAALCCAAAALAGLVSGCATPPLSAARANFYMGRLAQAEENLAALPETDKDKVLYLMERGTVRQALGRYEESATDWREAGELDKRLETYSVSRGASSLVVNDRTLSFRGAPFERVLLYAFLAKSYLAVSNWDFAAVAARNIIAKLEKLDGFPDDPYSRYLAGFCMEMIDDRDNAAILYRQAAELLPDLVIDESTGRIQTAAPAPDPGRAPGPARTGAELVCFVAMGRSPSERDLMQDFIQSGPEGYAEFYVGGEYLGRSYSLANVARLVQATENRLAAMRLAKTMTRVVIKDTVATAVEEEHPFWGALVRIILFSLETPDTRRWETLPMWLQVARFDCPPELDAYEVVFKGVGGQVLQQRTVSLPLSRRGRVFFSYCRDLPQPPPPPQPEPAP
ncbi:MAG: hypothetical protein JXR37_21945 [Kiritimatiellae bacterium]|nr:hypothetical protein [Kiritimatiellia bacterium]